MRVFESRKLLPSSALLLCLTLAVHGAASPGAAAVKNLAFDSKGQSLEVKISATEGAHYTYFELSRPSRLVVDFHEIQNRLDFKEKPIQIAGVERVRTSTFVDKKRRVTRIVFDLSGATPYHFTDEPGGVVKIVFGEAKSESGETAEAKDDANEGARAEAAVETASDSAPLNLTAGPVVAFPELEPALALERFAPQSTPQVRLSTTFPAQNPPPPPPPAPATAPAASAPQAAVPQTAAPAAAAAPQIPEAPQYTGELVSFAFRDITLRDFFDTIADISGLNIVLDPNVNGTLPLLKLTAVPWDQALDIVLRNYQLGQDLQGNVLRIATQAALQQEQDAKKKLRDALELGADLISQTYVLNYTKASDVTTTLTKMLSSRGSIIPDARRNAIIVTDIPSRFPKLDQTVKFLDTPAQQVEIEARILSANKSFSRSIGNQLGFLIGNGRNNQVTGSSAAGTSPLTRPNGIPALPLAVNLPAAATSGLSLLAGVGGDVLLDEIITAAEASGTAKVISRPRVVTQNNQAATVQNGTQIPVQTNVNNTISTQFINFALKLTVTPQITDVGTILMTVDIENSQPDFAKAVNGVPSVATQSAQTQYLIQDGGTQTIGGILVDNDSLNVQQVPGLGSLPLIGNLFKETSIVKSTSELLFFITARILPSTGGVMPTPPESQPRPQQPPR